LGVHERTEEILVGTDHYCPRVVGLVDRFDAGICRRTIHLHLVLGGCVAWFGGVLVFHDRLAILAIKRILHLSSTSGPGGAEMVVSRLAGALDRSRFRSLVCLYRPGWLKEQCERQGIETHVLDIGGMFDFGWVRRACRLVRSERISLIHAHEFTGNTYGSLVAKLVGVPLVATVHGKSYYSEQFKRRLAYRVVSRVGTMVAVSEDLKRFVTDSVGVPAERIKVIYNGQEILLPVRGGETARLRCELGMEEDEQVVGVVGSLYPVKGHKYLLAAIPHVLNAHPRTKFLIVGRGDVETSLKDAVKRTGLEKQVRFLGFREDVATLLSLMDIFVLPSLSEGLSIALLEAMAAGKPVVATNVGGNPELVVDGETGYSVPPRDADALATKLRSLLVDKCRAKKLGENGRKRVQQKFSLQAMADNYQRLYEECLQR
jgi:glycosyltransferase involved in cell wall biosynthesis